MASGGGFASGLGMGLQGMAQVLSQYVALKQADKDRGLRKAERDQDLAYKRERDVKDDSYRARQEKRQGDQDERQLVEKVLGSIAKPKTKIDGRIADAAERQGFGTFVHKSTPMPIMGPGGTFMGGADLGPTADPMISPAIQAQIDAIGNKSDYNDRSLDLKESIAAAQHAARMAQLGQAQTTLQAQIAKWDADREAVNGRNRSGLEATIRHQVTNEMLAQNPMAAYDEAQRGALMQSIDAEVQRRVAASFPGASGGGAAAGAPQIDIGPGSSLFDGLGKRGSQNNQLPWDPNVLPGGAPAPAPSPQAQGPQGPQDPQTIFDLPAPDVRGTLKSVFDSMRKGGRRFMDAIDAVPQAQANRRRMLQGK